MSLAVLENFALGGGADRWALNGALLDTNDRTRRAADLRRYLTLRGLVVDQVAARLKKTYKDADIIEGLDGWKDFTKLTNPHRDIAYALACAYKRGAYRRIEGASKRLEKIWASIWLESQIDMLATDWNRVAYGVGPVAIIPVVRRGAVRLERYPPHRWMPIFDPADPDDLDAIVVDLGPPRRTSKDTPFSWGPGWESRPAYAVIDREVWRYYDAQGKPTPGPGGAAVIPHGARDHRDNYTVPVAIARLDPPEPEDYWGGEDRPDRLHQATISAGVILARMLYVRQYQDGMKLLSLMPDDAIIEQGAVVANPGIPTSVTGRTAAAAKLVAVDYNTAPDNFLRTINAVITAAALAVGLPPEAVTLTAPIAAGRMQGLTTPKVSVTDSMRVGYQREQIGPMAACERRLHVITTSVVAASGHADADQMQSPDEAWDAFEAAFAELQAIDDPEKQRAQDDWEMGKGVISRVDVVMRAFPSYTRDDARQHIMQRVDEETEFWEVLAARNQSPDQAEHVFEVAGTVGAGATVAAKADVSGGGANKSAAQINGEKGPQVRDGKVQQQ